MDLVNQDKFKNLLIILLLVLNIITVSIIWVQTNKSIEPKQTLQDKSGTQSVNLMKEVLNLSEEQTKEFEKIRTSKLEQAKKYNDSLNLLKKQLAEELLKEKPDSTTAKIKSEEIGDLQTKVEMVRFKHFKELMRICTPEQKEKLKPIMVELFGRKPPREDQLGRQPIDEKRNRQGESKKNFEEAGLENNRNAENRNMPPPPRDERSAPPSIEDKLGKLNERLALTKEQEEKIRAIMSVSKQKKEQLRKRENPDPSEIEIEKEKTKREEDENIMKVLDENQKREFSKMLMKRKDKSK